MELKLIETRHPDKAARERYFSLVGIEPQKEELLDELLLLLDPNRLDQWLKKHHRRGLALAERMAGRLPLVIMSGEVGCGKTALASSIGTPLAEKLDVRLVVLETPSDIRGTGLVGELSARVTLAFSQAKTRIGNSLGILIIDEGDDLAASRAQTQAHHEDRAGLNVLIKEIDKLHRDSTRIVVILITNRYEALDPALVRRASLHMHFTRPGRDERRAFFERTLDGIDLAKGDLERLVEASERRDTRYTYSDLGHRVAGRALRTAIRNGEALSVQHVLEALSVTEPSPALGAGGPA